MNRNISDSSLANLKHFEGKWKHGATRTIRVPIALADRVLALARRLDNGESLDTHDESLKQVCDWASGQSHDRHTVESTDTSDIPDSEHLPADSEHLTIGLDLSEVEAADLLNKLKAKRKRSRADLGDVESPAGNTMVSKWIELDRIFYPFSIQNRLSSIQRDLV